MDPANTQKVKLAQWAQRMEFTLPDGSIPDESFFASATCTRNRRMLWEQVMKRIGDRRFIRKVLHEQSLASTDRVISREELRKIQQEKKVKVLKRIEDVEGEIAHRLARIEDQGKRLCEMESGTKTYNRRIILFEVLQKRERHLLQYQRNLNESLKLLCRPVELPMTSDTDSKEWLYSLEKETSLRWCDPGLKESINSRLIETGPWLSSTLLETTLVNSLEDFRAACSSSEKSVAMNELSFRSNAPPFGHHWVRRISKEKLASRVTEDLLHWCEGKRLAEEALDIIKTEKDNTRALASQISESLKLCQSMDAEFNGCDVISKEDIDSNLHELDEKVSDKLKHYNLMKKEVLEIRKCLEETNENIYICQRRIFDTVSSLRAIKKNEIGHWRGSLQTIASLRRKHSALLWDAPLKSIKMGPPDDLLMTPLESLKQSKNNEEEIEQFWLKIFHEISAQHDAIRSKKCILPPDREDEKQNQLAHNKDWMRHVVRTLSRTLEKSSVVTMKIEKALRAYRLMSDQPFGEMIPESVTFRGLTFKEFRMQHRLMKTLGQQLKGFDSEIR